MELALTDYINLDKLNLIILVYIYQDDLLYFGTPESVWKVLFGLGF